MPNSIPLAPAPRILLAEDSPDEAELALAALGAQYPEAEVVVVHDGAEALDYLHRRGPYETRPEGDPALVLLDLKMPRIDGLEVLRAVKSDPHLKTVPVVILSSSREEQDLARSYDLGANGYVVKPVAYPEFRAVIQSIGAYWATLNVPPPRRS